MYYQPKPTVLPCHLRGEHFGDHYTPLTRPSALADVASRVDVRVRGMTARDAEEGGLIGSVLLIDVSTLSALPGRVAGIDEDQRDASTFRLVSNERTKLAESPVAQSRALIATGRYPAADALEAFKSDPASGAFSVQHDSLGNHVIGVFLEPRLFAGQFPEFSFGTLGAEPLQTIPAALLPSPLLLDHISGIAGPVAVSSERDDAEVDAQPVLSFKLVGLRDIAGRREEPFSTNEAEIDLAFAVGHQSLLVLTHYNGNYNATFDGPQTDRAAVFDETNDPIIIGLRGIHAEDRCNLAVDLEGIRHLGDRPDGGLSGQTESAAYLDISQFVQVVLPERLSIEPSLGQPGTGFITARQGRLQARCLGWRRQDLEGGNQFHIVKYGYSSRRKQVIFCDLVDGSLQ